MLYKIFMKIFQILRKKSTACKQWSTGRLEIYWKAWLIDYFLYFNLFIWPIWIIYTRAPLNKWSLSEREDTFFYSFLLHVCLSVTRNLLQLCQKGLTMFTNAFGLTMFTNTFIHYWISVSLIEKKSVIAYILLLFD